MFTSPREERAALLLLLRSRPQGKNWTDLTAAVLERGSVEQTLADLEPDQLFVDPARDDALAKALDEVDVWENEGLSFLTVLDDRYPSSLREIHKAPPFLFARGEARDGDVGVSVVGSREASDRGLQMAESIATALVHLGVSVVSGLAAGIDAAAHRAALAAGGRPVGVIGTGIRKQYPARQPGASPDVAQRGLLLSQFWPDAPPQKHTFLMRNATMSGYGVATVVIEASEHSGARAQARMAVEHGRPVVLTDLVVERTQWAKSLIGRPGVHVASATADVEAVVRELLAKPGRVEHALGQLISV